MTDSEDFLDAVSSRSFGGASIDPEAQAVVTDFLDYTEYLPSDLTRSYTLIRTLDETYEQHVAKVHSLTTTYGKLPGFPANERPDASTLRRDISLALDKALAARAAACEEAKRINQVVERHMARLQTIKTKLKALPKPPSRDPTPVPPASPIRSRKESEKHRFLKTDRKKTPGRYFVPGDILPVEDFDDFDDDDEYLKKKSPTRRRHTLDADIFKKTPKTQRMQVIPKTARPPKVRTPGAMGTNAHSQVAGISTTNALALLTPPPADAPAGSMWRPWFKLTEYEMAKLRKSMKKNAVWTPSEAMVRRELHKDGRGRDFYDKAKAEAEEKGEALLDEESIDVLKSQPGRGAINRDEDGSNLKINLGMKLNEAKKLKKEKEAVQMDSAGAEEMDVDDEGNADHVEKDEQNLGKRAHTRQQTREQALQFNDLNSKLAQMGQQMKNLFDSSVKLPPPLTRSGRKRKRDSQKETNGEFLGQESASTSPTHAPKKAKTGDVIDPSLETPSKRSSSKMDAEDTPATTTIVKTMTTTVPLAPEGPSSPLSPVDFIIPSSGSDKKNAIIPVATAATSRPRRASAIPLKVEEIPPTPSVEPAHHKTRGRVGQSATPQSLAVAKAASAEPPARKHELRNRKEIRRLSVNAETTPSTPTAAIARGARTGARAGGRRPPGLVMAEDKNGKGRVSLGRRKAQPTRKQASSGAQKKSEEEEEEEEDDDEETYCVCGGVSWGTMVACDNPDCEKEWFHISCVGLSKAPDKDAKWYCPDCKDKVPKRPGRTRR